MIPLWIWIIAVLLVVGIAVAVLLSSYENKRLTVEYYEIESEKIPEAFDGYRIVFLTDLHCAQFGENNQELIERIDECRPDMILVGGDMVISRESSNEEVPLALMKELYRIASTGEYSYLQDFEKISYKDDVFEHMWEEAGKSEILYAGRLLRYYYLVKEKA